MELNFEKLGQDMGTALLNSLKSKAPDIEDYAAGEGMKMSQSIATISSLLTAGRITPEEAKLQLEIQKQAARAVLLCVEGLGVLTVESAINAALGVVRDMVNKALGFALI